MYVQLMKEIGDIYSTCSRGIWNDQ